jgi:hypothetical protein
VLAGSSPVAAARLVAWLALVALGVLGGGAPGGYVTVATAAAATVAALAVGGTVSSMWRGPPVVAFAPEDSLWCGEEESEPVRAYAQLRGMIGGAGHVYPRRLVFPLLAWSAALVAGARPLFWPDLEVLGTLPAAVAMGSAFATWLFPARPYWYREVMGGGAMVSPPEAVAALVARERCEPYRTLAAIHETGRADPLLRTPRAPEPVVPATREVYIDSSGHLRAGDALGVPERPQRYALDRKIVVEQDGVEIEVATVNVSSGGLAVRWPGELPVIGTDLVVRLAEDDCELEAVVCWKRVSGGREKTVGLKLEGNGTARARWREVVARAAGVGARARTPQA